MYLKKFHAGLFFCFLWLIQLTAMKEDHSSEQISMDELTKQLETMLLNPQKNFKKICFGFVDNKKYNFKSYEATEILEYQPAEFIELACHLKKILKLLKKDDTLLFLKLGAFCECLCTFSMCHHCIRIREIIKNNFHGSISKASKQLKKKRQENRENFLETYGKCACTWTENYCLLCQNRSQSIKQSNHKAIKALKEIRYDNRFILDKNGEITTQNKKLLLKIINEIYKK